MEVVNKLKVQMKTQEKLNKYLFNSAIWSKAPSN